MKLHPQTRRFLDNIVSITALAAIFTILCFTIIFQFHGGRIEISRGDLVLGALKATLSFRPEPAIAIAYVRILPTFEDTAVFLSPTLMPPLIVALLLVVLTQWCTVETVKATATGDGQRQLFLLMIVAAAMVIMLQLAGFFLVA